MAGKRAADAPTMAIRRFHPGRIARGKRPGGSTVLAAATVAHGRPAASALGRPVGETADRPPHLLAGGAEQPQAPGNGQPSPSGRGGA